MMMEESHFETILLKNFKNSELILPTLCCNANPYIANPTSECHRELCYEVK